MLPIHKWLIVALCAFTFVGCCGLPGMQTQGAASPFNASSQTSVLASQTTFDGCTVQGGVACGGKSLGALKLEFPDPRPLLGFFGIPLGTQRAQVVYTQADPCQTTYVQADPCGR